MDFGHGGNMADLARRAGLAVEAVLDFSASFNPLGPPENLRSIISRSLGSIVHYPDPFGSDLVTALASHHGVPAEQIVVGNGSTELLYALPRILPVERALIPVPSYSDYQTAASREGLAVKRLLLGETDHFSLNWSALEKSLQRGDMVVVGQPNNPTGRRVDSDQLVSAADLHPHVIFVVDEAFADFIPGYESLIHRMRSNIVVVRSMTKFYAIPGLRLGYAMATPEYAGRLRDFLPPWSVGTLAQSVGMAVLDDTAYAEKTRNTVGLLRRDLASSLAGLPGLEIYESEANYILLKPNSDMGSQVIVMGKPVGNMEVPDYIGYKELVFETVCKAYDDLSAQADVMVLEGAGSPAEVNLKSHDIVNLAMAEYARATALLVGDIDRGGVFASFAGTMDFLSERERALIAGFVINLFRGKKELLDDAIALTRYHTGLPTFGVVPYVHDLGLPEEDSVSFKAGATVPCHGDRRESIEIAFVDLPHISNFTDFDALMQEPDVHLCIVRWVADLGQPDALIIPGSKNTIEDLAHLKSSGLTDRIISLARKGNTELVGICGGFQMLCKAIEDPLTIESRRGRIQGLGLLDAFTTIVEEKSLRLVSARHLVSGLPVKGYEIHHGKTMFKDIPPSVVREDGEVIGLVSADQRTWGTYLHGIFDDDRFRRWFIDSLRKTRGMAPMNRVLAAFDVDAALDRLADVVRSNMKISDIYRNAGLL